jgi:hypothetical protein
MIALAVLIAIGGGGPGRKLAVAHTVGVFVMTCAAQPEGLSS